MAAVQLEAAAQGLSPAQGGASRATLR
jgi:hypothetical protein